MFKITPIQDKDIQRQICELCGAEFRSDAFAYMMFDIDTDDIMGMSQFEIGETGYIFDLKEAPGHDDFEAMFILARQTMNFIDLCGAHNCYIDENAGSKRLIISVGFKETDGRLYCDMTGMFSGHCDGHGEVM